MATRKTTWGYTRLRGALKNVGYEVGRNTIKRILRERGIEPAPLRRRRHSWATFIKAHLSAMAAADFFTVEVLSLLGLVRYHLLFVIHLATRRRQSAVRGSREFDGASCAELAEADRQAALVDILASAIVAVQSRRLKPGAKS